jgi:hypothetical protein
MLPVLAAEDTKMKRTRVATSGRLSSSLIILDSCCRAGTIKHFQLFDSLSEAEIAELQRVWGRYAAIMKSVDEISWLEKHVGKSEDR